MVHQISVPHDLRIGPGSLAELPNVFAKLGVKRPVIVTDKFLVGAGVANDVARHLSAGGAQPVLFDGVIPDPTTDSLAPALDLIREHDADALVGLGGGSPIDTAKALAVLAVHGGPLRDLKAPVLYDGPALPVVAIPTTAGTGSEATRYTIVTDSETGEKMLVAGSSYLPTGAIVDMELTLSMPPRLTADTGIDALTHAVEAYVSRKANAFSDSLALGAIRLIGPNLRRVYVDGSDRDARSAMMEAATLAGIAFSNASVALVHGMSRPLGAHFGVAHGMANAMLFPTVTEFSVGSAVERYADVARVLGVATANDADDDASRALVVELKQLAADTQVPTPRDFGIDHTEWEAKIPTMAAQALASGSPGNNPRVPEQAEIEQLYREMFG